MRLQLALLAGLLGSASLACQTRNFEKYSAEELREFEKEHQGQARKLEAHVERERARPTDPALQKQESMKERLEDERAEDEGEVVEKLNELDIEPMRYDLRKTSADSGQASTGPSAEELESARAEAPPEE